MRTAIRWSGCPSASLPARWGRPRVRPEPTVTTRMSIPRRPQPEPLSIVATAGGVTNTQTVLVQSGANTIPVAVGTIQSASVSANPSVVSTNVRVDQQPDADSRSVRRSQQRADPERTSPVRPRRRSELGGRNVLDRLERRLLRCERRCHDGVHPRRAVEPDRRRHDPGLLRQRRLHDLHEVRDNDDHGDRPRIRLRCRSAPTTLIINGPNDLTYIRQYVVLVVDSSGVAKANVNIVPVDRS